MLAYTHKFKEGVVYDVTMLVMDSLGLGAFTVTGIAVAWSSSVDGHIFLQLFVGVLTGVGGGVLRDVLAGNTPYIFVKHVYACASLLGAVACVYLRGVLGDNYAMLCGMVLVIGSRRSSNSTRLREIAESRGCRAFLIDGPEVLPPEVASWPGPIGVSAGASAPEELVERTVVRLGELGFGPVRLLGTPEQKLAFAPPEIPESRPASPGGAGGT